MADNNQTLIVNCYLVLFFMKVADMSICCDNVHHVHRAVHEHWKMFWGFINSPKEQYTCIVLFVLHVHDR